MIKQKLTALIIDDEENAKKLLKKFLEQTHYFIDIRLAHSVTSANNELAKFQPDLIFLDIKMPGKDGITFIHDLSPKITRPEIVFVTAYDQYAIQAVKNQAFDYLLKPVDRKELKQCIINFIKKYTHWNYICKSSYYTVLQSRGKLYYNLHK
jgi:two-component system LytT family response regulator